MTPEQKQRIAHEISNWRNARKDHSAQLTGDRMAELLQELVDAPEPEPVAHATGFYAGYLLMATVADRTLPVGTALYTAPPAPSVPVEPMENIALNEWLDKTEWVQKEINTFPVSSLGMHRADVMRLEIERLRKLLAAAPTPAEAHQDDIAVDRFASAMKAKMAKQRNKGYGGWDDAAICPANRLRHLLNDHVAKGDPVDVGNFAMMLFNRGEVTTPAELPADVARDAERWRMLPAFLEEFEISYLRLEDAIDAAIAAEKGQS